MFLVKSFNRMYKHGKSNNHEREQRYREALSLP